MGDPPNVYTGRSGPPSEPGDRDIAWPSKAAERGTSSLRIYSESRAKEPTTLTVARERRMPIRHRGRKGLGDRACIGVQRGDSPDGPRGGEASWRIANEATGAGGKENRTRREAIFLAPGREGRNWRSRDCARLRKGMRSTDLCLCSD